MAAQHHDDGHDTNLAHHFESIDQQRQSAKLGMWVFLATEILFFGSSNAGADFDPKLVPDQRAYDLWWAGAGTDTIAAFGQEFGVPLFDPETVVVHCIVPTEAPEEEAVEGVEGEAEPEVIGGRKDKDEETEKS